MRFGPSAAVRRDGTWSPILPQEFGSAVTGGVYITHAHNPAANADLALRLACITAAPSAVAHSQLRWSAVLTLTPRLCPPVDSRNVGRLEPNAGLA
jgi:hypothetical protein